MKKLWWILVGCICIYPFHVCAVDTSARSAILMEQNSHRILYAKNIHEVRTVASISKIMTGLLAVESGKLGDMVEVGSEIKEAYGSAVYIKEGEKITLEDLVYALMLRSGNDAALAIATYVSGSEERFIEKMNQRAKELGMKETTFHNPHGLDEGKLVGNFSSAYDMAILQATAMQNKTFAKIVGTKTHKVSTNKNTYVWHNKNKLLKNYKYTTGGKTGFTEKARRTLVSSARKDNLNLVSVTLDDGNDFADHMGLFDYGFETYKDYQILKKGSIEIYDDTYYKDYELYLKNSFSYPLLDTEKDHIVLKFVLEKKRKYKRNSKIGSVQILLNEEKIGEEAIYIADLKESKKGFFSKIKSWFSHD